MVQTCETLDGRLFRATPSEMDKFGNLIHQLFISEQNGSPAYFDMKQLPSKNRNKWRYRVKDGSRYVDISYYENDNPCSPATLTVKTGKGDIQFQWGDGEPLGVDLPEEFKPMLDEFLKSYRDSYYEPVIIGIVARLHENNDFWTVWES